jgi:membrane-associated phospholipid phosphatase
VRFAFAFLSAAFAALATAFAAGAFTGIDQWAVDHVMPGGHFTTQQANVLHALVPLAGTHWDSAWSVATAVVAMPASFLVALALTAWRSRALGALVLAGTAIEALCKHVLSRPELHQGALHIVGFDDSFPSGHTLRVVLVAAAFASPLSVVWAVAAIVLIELGGWHTPSDILGGLLLALLGLSARSFLGARALRGRRLLRGRA